MAYADLLKSCTFKTRSIKNFYKQCTDKNWDDINLESEEFDKYLELHFEICCDPKIQKLLLEMEHEKNELFIAEEGHYSQRFSY